MSRSGYAEYDDFDDQWQMIRWAGASSSARRGKRGQAFFRDLLAALDALPEKKLIVDSLRKEDGNVCALGAVAAARGIPTDGLDPEDYDKVAGVFDIAPVLARDIVFVNDDDFGEHPNESEEERFIRVRRWVERQIIEWET